MALALLQQRVSGWLKTLINIVLVASWGMPVIVAIHRLQVALRHRLRRLQRPAQQAPRRSDMVGHNRFASGPQGLLVIMLLVVWGAVPFVVITLSAGLTQVPQELEEAASPRRRRRLGCSSGTSPCPSSSRSS
ncbi:ABC transporter permease subunit [Streptomyces sp. L7]